MSESNSGDLRGRLNDSVSRITRDMEMAQAKRLAAEAQKAADLARRQALQLPITALLRGQISEFVDIMRERGGKPQVQLIHTYETKVSERKAGLLGRFGVTKEVSRESTESVDTWLLSSQARATAHSKVQGSYSGSGPRLKVEFRGLAVDPTNILHVYRGGFTSESSYESPMPSSWSTFSWMPIPVNQYTTTSEHTPYGFAATNFTGQGITFSATNPDTNFSVGGPLLWAGSASEAVIPELLAPLEKIKPAPESENLNTQPLVTDFQKLLHNIALSSLRLR